MWHNMGHALNFNLSYNKKEIKAQESPFFLVFPRERERGRERKGTKASLLDLRSSVGWFSYEQRTKVHLIVDDYTCLLEKKDFAKDLREEFGGNRGFRFRKCPRDFLQQLLHSSYSSFSSHFWADFWVKMVERVKGMFGQKNAQNPTFFA